MGSVTKSDRVTVWS